MTGAERARLAAGVEALDAADVEEARQILHRLLRDAERAEHWECRPRCPACGDTFDHPGLRDRHLAVSLCGLTSTSTLERSP